MKNVLYLGFFILKTNYADLNKSIHCTVKKGYSKYRLILDMVFSAILYGSSFVDYFNFQFYRKNRAERKAYATMGIMYKFHKKVNDKNYIAKIDDKKHFSVNFAEYCNKPFFYTKDQYQELIRVLGEKSGKKIVIKDPTSTGGKGVQVVEPNLFLINKFGIKRILLEFLFRMKRNYWRNNFKTPDGMLLAKDHKAVTTLQMLTHLKDLPKSNTILEISVHPSRTIEDLEDTVLTNERIEEYDYLRSQKFLDFVRQDNTVSYKIFHKE